MVDLTVTIDDGVLRRARIRALEHGTSVNALLDDYPVAYAGRDDMQDQAFARLLDLSSTSASRRGSAPRTRDELHDRSSS